MIGESPWKVLNIDGLSEFVSLEVRRRDLEDRIVRLAFDCMDSQTHPTKEEMDDLEVDEQILIGDCKAFYKKWRKE